MIKKLSTEFIVIVIIVCACWSCKTPALITRAENRTVPAAFAGSQDTLNAGAVRWREYFTDTNLIALVDTALKNNQEMNIALQEIDISRNDITARKGEYLPFVNLGAAGGVDKAGAYTRDGAVEENLPIKSGKVFPRPLPDVMLGVFTSWEIDVWKKLRNARKAAVLRYLATVEGRNFIITNMIAEIASSYYELMAMDNLTEIVQRNITLQSNAFQMIKLEKDAAKVTQLAVNRFEAQLLNTQNLLFEIQQKIVESENRINFLTGRFPQPVRRNSSAFNELAYGGAYTGLPSQLLSNRPDIRQAEMELAAAKLDVKIARANFYPSLRLTAGVGVQAFNPVYLVSWESMLYRVAADLAAPLVNRNNIKAEYSNAGSRQMRAVYNYERLILNAHVEVVNQLSRMNNYTRSFETKSREAEILTQSASISNNLFKSARADYVEVLLTQREALESKLDLVEIKLKVFAAKVNLYRALGGGWN